MDAAMGIWGWITYLTINEKPIALTNFDQMERNLAMDMACIYNNEQ